MAKKNPYLLSAAQIRAWAVTHNEEAWVLLLRMLDGQNTFFGKKRGEEMARLIQRLEEQLARGDVADARAPQLRKVLAEVKRVAAAVEKNHRTLKTRLSALSGSSHQLEKRLERLRALQAKKLSLDSKWVKDVQRAKEAARKRELEAQRTAAQLMAKGVAKAAPR